MRIGEKVFILGTAAILAAAHPSFPTEAFAGAGPMIRLADMDGGNNGGSSVNLTVRQVTVHPIRAHVGDVVHIEMWVENQEDGGVATTPAVVQANGKEVGAQLFNWGLSAGDRTHKLKFDWDTRGFAPGEYTIRAEAFVFEDVSPFDNDLALKQPVILAAPGGEFPRGEKAGGSATETDPRYK